VQQLRDEIELEAGQLQPEFGEQANEWAHTYTHTNRTATQFTSALPLPMRSPTISHPPHCPRLHMPALHLPSLHLPASAPLQTSMLCAASCAPASTTFSSQTKCSWWVGGWAGGAGWVGWNKQAQ
jgi:hypothetical protein